MPESSALPPIRGEGAQHERVGIGSPFLPRRELPGRQHGGHLGGTTTRLLRLLDVHGLSEFDFALAEAHLRGAFAAQSVAHILDQRRRARKAAVPLPFVLPDDPRVRDLRVPARPLGAYDALARSGERRAGRP